MKRCRKDNSAVRLDDHHQFDDGRGDVGNFLAPAKASDSVVFGVAPTVQYVCGFCPR